MINEDGLPIHEIREDPEGKPLGPVPAALEEEDAPVMKEEPVEDYWFDAAVARRAALRRKVFNEGGSSDEADEEDFPSKEPLIPRLVEPASPPSPDRSPSPVPSSPPRRLSSTSQPPKSILKPPTRKKSVSFDESVILPPDSPAAAKIGGTVFPVPNGEFEPRPVPVIAEPKPSVKNGVSEKGFAGFKRGFLAGPGKPTNPDTNKTITTNGSETTTSSRKRSLFSQRMAQQEEASISPTTMIPPYPIKPGSTPAVNLPKMSESKQMPSLKPTVMENSPMPPIALSPPKTGNTASDPHYPEGSDGDHNDSLSPSEEDEYDLDDALLAREAALEYHRRRAYLSLEKEDEEGGVMIGVPHIDGKRIVNPTPEDLRKFVRVGKLEKGNLVLAPGEAEWSDSDRSEGDEEDSSEKAKGKRRKREMKRRLMGLDGDEEASQAMGLPKASEDQTVGSLPPVVVPSVKEGAATGHAVPPDPAPSKKVSRFKATRMGM